MQIRLKVTPNEQGTNDLIPHANQDYICDYCNKTADRLIWWHSGVIKQRTMQVCQQCNSEHQSPYKEVNNMDYHAELCAKYDRLVQDVVDLIHGNGTEEEIEVAKRVAEKCLHQIFMTEDR